MEEGPCGSGEQSDRSRTGDTLRVLNVDADPRNADWIKNVTGRRILKSVQNRAELERELRAEGLTIKDFMLNPFFDEFVQSGRGGSNCKSDGGSDPGGSNTGEDVINTSSLTEAFSYAAERHSSQQRKGTSIPYISHLMQVAGLVMEAGGDEEQTIAALLHDAIEDAPGGEADQVRSEIRDRFGDRVLAIVEGAATPMFSRSRRGGSGRRITSSTCRRHRRTSS